MAYGTLGYGSQAYGAWEYGTRRPVLLEGAPVHIQAATVAPLHKVIDVAGDSGIYTAAGVDMLRLLVAMVGSSSIKTTRVGQLHLIRALAGSPQIVLSSDAMLETLNRFGGSGVILTSASGQMQRVARLAATIAVKTTKSASMRRIAPMGATVSITVALTDQFRIDLYFKPQSVEIVISVNAVLLTVLPLRGKTHIQLDTFTPLQRLPKLTGRSYISLDTDARLTGTFRFIGDPVHIETVTYGALRKEWEPLDYAETIWADASYTPTAWVELDHGHDDWRPFDHFSQSQ